MLNIEKYKYEITLLAITLLGTLMRVFQLTKNSMWLDEVFTLNVAQLPFAQIWEFTVSSIDVHPPLFYWMEHVAILLFGTTSFSLRIFPCITGSLTIPIFYYIGKEMAGNKGIGILSAFIISITTFHILHSQDARMYSLYLFLFSISIYYFIRFLNTDKISYALISYVFVAFCVYTHYTGILIGAMFVTASIILKNKKLIYGAVACILLCLPILPTIVSILLLNPSNPFYLEAGRTANFIGIDAMTRTLSYLLGNSVFSSILFMLVVLGIYNLYEKNSKITAFSLAVIGVSMVASCISSYKIPIEPRYFIYLLPFVVVFMSCGLGSIYHAIRSRYPKLNRIPIISVILIVLLVLHIPMLSFYYTENTKSDYRGLSSKIAGLTSKGDSVVVIPGGTARVFELYYNSTDDDITVYYINKPSDIDDFLDQKTEGNTIIIVTSDIKYNPYKSAYEEKMPIIITPPLLDHDTFKIYNEKIVYTQTNHQNVSIEI